MALKWIQKNIKVFGGDPKKVTIAGQGSGAACVSFHLLSPLSSGSLLYCFSQVSKFLNNILWFVTGVFHAAIAQSGSAFCPWALEEEPLGNSKRLAKELNCATEDIFKMGDCLKTKGSQEIIKAERKLGSQMFSVSIRLYKLNECIWL